GENERLATLALLRVRVAELADRVEATALAELLERLTRRRLGVGTLHEADHGAVRGGRIADVHEAVLHALGRIDRTHLQVVERRRRVRLAVVLVLLEDRFGRRVARRASDDDELPVELDRRGGMVLRHGELRHLTPELERLILELGARAV